MSGTCSGGFAGRYRRCTGECHLRIRRVFGFDDVDARVCYVDEVVTVRVIIAVIIVFSLMRA